MPAKTGDFGGGIFGTRKGKKAVKGARLTLFSAFSITTPIRPALHQKYSSLAPLVFSKNTLATIQNVGSTTKYGMNLRA
jgi:hypothetical protein